MTGLTHLLLVLSILSCVAFLACTTRLGSPITRRWRRQPEQPTTRVILVHVPTGSTCETPLCDEPAMWVIGGWRMCLIHGLEALDDSRTRKEAS